MNFAAYVIYCIVGVILLVVVLKDPPSQGMLIAVIVAAWIACSALTRALFKHVRRYRDR